MSEVPYSMLVTTNGRLEAEVARLRTERDEAEQARIRLVSYHAERARECDRLRAAIEKLRDECDNRWSRKVGMSAQWVARRLTEMLNEEGES